MKLNKKIEQLSEVLLKNSALDIYQHILKEYTIEDLLICCYQDRDNRLAFRAAWTLEHILLRDSTLLTAYASQIIKLYGDTDNESSLRSISKIVIQLLKSKTKVSSIHTEDTIEKSFQILEKENCPIALLVNVWDILHLLSCKHDWIIHELKLHVTFYLEKHATPASRSRGQRILKKLSTKVH